MIEITAKQLYEIYDVLQQEKWSITRFPIYKEHEEEHEGRLVTFVRVDDKREWKPTTDLIIKA